MNNPIDIDFNIVKVQMFRLKQLADVDVQRQLITMLVERVAVTGQSLVSDPPVPVRKPRPLKYLRTAADGSTYMSKWKSKKQQGFVFGVLIPNKRIPYKRGRGVSEQLTASLGLLPYKVSRTGKTWSIVWGLDQTYAPLVVGQPDEQADYHEDVWTPLEDDIMSDTALKQYKEVFTVGLQRSVNALDKGSGSPFTV